MPSAWRRPCHPLRDNTYQDGPGPVPRSGTKPWPRPPPSSPQRWQRPGCSRWPFSFPRPSGVPTRDLPAHPRPSLHLAVLPGEATRTAVPPRCRLPGERGGGAGRAAPGRREIPSETPAGGKWDAGLVGGQRQQGSIAGHRGAGKGSSQGAGVRRPPPSAMTVLAQGRQRLRVANRHPTDVLGQVRALARSFPASGGQVQLSSRLRA